MTKLSANSIMPPGKLPLRTPPPVYRPVAAAVKAPPVYRPSAAVAPKAGTATQTAPPVYRPATVVVAKYPTATNRAVVNQPVRPAPTPGLSRLPAAPFQSARTPVPFRAPLVATQTVQRSRDSRALAIEEAMDDPQMVVPGAKRRQKRQARRAPRREFERSARNTSLGTDRFAAEDSSGLSSMVQAIMRDYPPRKWVYVGIGASPEVPLELLRRAGGQTISLPLSGVKKVGEWDDLSPEQKKRAMIDVRYHLSVYATRNSNLLLLDATDTNATLTTLEAVIRASDMQNGVRRKVETLSISETKTLRLGEPETIPDTNIKVLEVDDRPARQVMRGRIFQQWYKNNLGRSVAKREFEDVVSGNEPPVKTSESSRKYIVRFAHVVRAKNGDEVDLDEL